MNNTHREYRVTYGDTLEELRQDIENMAAALHKPVLHIDE